MFECIHVCMSVSIKGAGTGGAGGGRGKGVWQGVGVVGIYLNAIKMSMIMQTAITPPRINESLLFLKLIF